MKVEDEVTRCKCTLDPYYIYTIDVRGGGGERGVGIGGEGTSKFGE